MVYLCSNRIPEDKCLGRKRCCKLFKHQSLSGMFPESIMCFAHRRGHFFFFPMNGDEQDLPVFQVFWSSRLTYVKSL